jgi:hypothetical protein
MSWLVRNAAPLGVAAATYALAVGLPAADPDMYWHLASGRWMIEHGALLREDIFSSTIRGQTYSVGEWLGQVGLALAHQAGSWQGLAALRALLVAAAAFFLVRCARRFGAPWPAAILVSLFALLLSKQSWGDRPQLFSLALFPLALELCFAARAGDRRALVLLPPLLLLWVNLHGGYALGLAVVGVFALEALLRRRGAVPFALTTVASGLVTLLDPGALGIASAASHVLVPPRFIVEEMPPDVLRPAGLLFTAFVAAALVGALATGGTLIEALLLVPLLWLGLSAQRHLHWFAFAATPFLAAQAAILWGRLPYRRGRAYPLPPAAQAALAVALVIGALGSTLSAPAAPDEGVYPVAAGQAIRTGEGRLLHEYDWGGWLIYRHPERPVFIDGRLFPFVPVVLDDYVEMTTLRPRWRETLERYGIREVLLRPHRPLVAALRDAGWSVRAEAADFVLLARP